MPEKETDKVEVIIIAEDSMPNRKILSLLLTKLGYRVIACEDGQQAWDAFQKDDTGNLVAVISDILMPNCNGLTFLKRVREGDKRKDIPFVFAAAVTEKEYILQAKELNFNGSILKPITFQRVTTKLQDLFPEKKFPKLAS